MKLSKLSRKNIVLLMFLILLASTASSSQAYGDGSDGSLTVTSSQVVNDYTYITGDESSGSSSISVNDASKFSSGDEVMIIQMQNGTGNGVAGRYEFREIKSTSSDTLTVNGSLEDSYFSGNYDEKTAEVTQVVRVPEYTNVKIESGGQIKAKQWDGYAGGVTVFRAKDSIKVEGKISASEKGFRGGKMYTGGSSENYGYQGESYKGSGERIRDFNAGGGGATNGDTAGGAGYGTDGENGETANHKGGYGGQVYGRADLNTIFPGSGGGGGTTWGGDYGATDGATGGGIVYLSSPKIRNKGEILSNGDDVTGQEVKGDNDGNQDTFCHGGGASSGGSIYLLARNISNPGVVSAKGGEHLDGSEYPSECNYYLAAGGDGRIRVDYNSISGISDINPEPGYEGDAPDFCDERGPQNECFIKSERDVSSQDIEVTEPFKSFTGSEIFSSTFTPLTVQKQANLSGVFRGSLNFSAEDITVKPGASFKPENGRIVLDER